MSLRCAIGFLLVFILGACAKHENSAATFKPVSAFSGRLLVMGAAKRIQVEVDWRGDEKQGEFRLTHGLSGRIIDVVWQNQTILWHDNTATAWQPLSEQALYEMGVLLPPWTLADILLGHMPASMKTKDNRTWSGTWDGRELRVRWASEQQRLELVDLKQGGRAVVVFHD